MTDATFHPDLSDPDRCISAHWSLPVQCVLKRSHRENWHEAWHPESGNRLRYRYPLQLTQESHGGEWHDLVSESPCLAEDKIGYIRRQFGQRPIVAELLKEIDRLRESLAKEERDQGQLIDERDQAQKAADDLAYAIAPIEVIGEHSGGNCPWTNAYEITQERDWPGLAAEPPRPSPGHMAVYIDQHNSGAWVDYPTVPPGDDVLPLVTANEVASSRAGLAEEGVVLRIVGWIQ